MKRYVAWMMMVALGAIFLTSGTTMAAEPGFQPTLYVVGTAHLDTQWRWTVRETIDEFVPATFRDNKKLMDLFPDYNFTFEGAFHYMILKEYYPDEFAQLKKYIADDRWKVAGSWVNAVDVNIPSFESIVRQTLYGNGFYEEEFGKRSRDIFLPDCFGFGYALPSMAAHCGLRSFSTQKLSWGAAVPVPFDIGLWKGVDGSSIIAALRPGAYVTDITDDLSRDTAWASTIQRQADSTGLAAGYMYFGTGDTGGAPDSESVAWLEKSIHGSGPIRVASIGSDEIVDFVDSAADISLHGYEGELLMTRHGIGCYTSQAAMKRWNRKNELLADAAERASVIAHYLTGAPYPRQALKETWIRFLWHQFHDDLTGTSIPEAYQYSWNDEILCLNRFSNILTNAVKTSAAVMDTRTEGVPIVVFNPLSIARQDVVEATIGLDEKAPEFVRVYGPDGEEVPSQIIDRATDSITVIFLADVPSVGYAVYDVRKTDKPCEITTGLTAGENTLENNRFIVTIDTNGDIASIYDKIAKREIIDAPVTFQLLFDKPRQWPAWEIQYEDIIAEPTILTDTNASIRIVENGPVRVGIEVIRQWNNSIFRTTISLSAGKNGEWVAFDNVIDWYEKETLLKVAVTSPVPSDSVVYDIGLGTIKRGLNHEELYEVPGQQWADMTPPGGEYGIAILNDCKYGWDHPDAKTLRLTLIHTPGVFDNWSWVKDQQSQDMGHHRVSFAISGHTGGWQESGVAWKAARFNQPLLSFRTGAHEGSIGKSFSLVSAGDEDNPEAMITAVKMAEGSDEAVIRIRETAGRHHENVMVTFGATMADAREINGVEQPIGPVSFAASTLSTALSPYQPKSFAATLNQTGAFPDSPKYKPVELPFNEDGISGDEDRRDGDFDGWGNTLAGELMPGVIDYSGIPFVTGSKNPGEFNVLACAGQTIPIEKGFDRLDLLITAIGGPAVGEFGIGDKDTTLKIQDYAEPIGQWNNRLVNGMLVESPQLIAPEYILRQPVAWTGTHRHNAEGENEAYQFTNLFYSELPIPAMATSLRLPNNPRIKVLAATLVTSDSPRLTPAFPIFDIADNALARIHAERTYFLDSMVVDFDSPTPGATIHYTVDGGDPTSQSPVFTRPVVIRENTQVKARAVSASMPDGYVTQLNFTKLIPYAPTEVANPQPGLACSYFEGEWNNLPNFDSLEIVKHLVLDTIMIPKEARDEDYGLVFTGFVNVPTAGLYDFSISSDDGSALYVCDSLVADNDGIHGDGEITGSIALEAGYYPIKALMFQKKGGEALSASIKGPGIEKQIIPAAWLVHLKK